MRCQNRDRPRRLEILLGVFVVAVWLHFGTTGIVGLAAAIAAWEGLTSKLLVGRRLDRGQSQATAGPTERPASLGGLGCGDAELGQEAAVVGLYPLFGESPVLVVSEGADHFPLEVLAGGLGRGRWEWVNTPVKSPENVVRAARKLPSTM